MTDFDDFYRDHYADLVVQVYAYFGDRQEAQDVVQEAFCRALARWSRLAGYDDPAAARRAVRRRRAGAASGVAGLAIVTAAVAAVAVQPADRPDRSAGRPPAIATATASVAMPAYAAAAAQPHLITEQPAIPGPHAFVITCSGTGAGRATLTAGALTATATVTCGQPPVRSRIEIIVPAGVETVTLRIDLDSAVLSNTAEGWAVTVEGA